MTAVLSPEMSDIDGGSLALRQHLQSLPPLGGLLHFEPETTTSTFSTPKSFTPYCFGTFDRNRVTPAAKLNSLELTGTDRFSLSLKKNGTTPLLATFNTLVSSAALAAGGQPAHYTPTDSASADLIDMMIDLEYLVGHPQKTALSAHALMDSTSTDAYHQTKRTKLNSTSPQNTPPIPPKGANTKPLDGNGAGESEEEDIYDLPSAPATTAKATAASPAASAAPRQPTQQQAAQQRAHAQQQPPLAKNHPKLNEALRASLAPTAGGQAGVSPMLPPFDNLHMQGVSIANMTPQQQQTLAALAAASSAAASKKKKGVAATQPVKKDGDIWNVEESDERKRVKEFWLSLTEEHRNALIRLEKEAVLRKMKEQQKHTCTCSVCGRRRTAIEEELEMLYDAYYEELERYTEKQGEPGGFNFFKNLGVKGSILSVADDLMKNEGKKFLEMMEKLAERRIRKDTPYPSNQSILSSPPSTAQHMNSFPGACLEPEEPDEDSGTSEDAATEEQRLEEGKRMFQMFAAKMFEQRILSAYREKVALEKQQKLIEEEEENERRNKDKREKERKKREQKKQRRKLKQQEEELERKRKEKEEKAKEEAEKKEMERKKQAQEAERRRREAELQKKREEERIEAERKKLQEYAENKRRQEQAARDREAAALAAAKKSAPVASAPTPAPVVVIAAPAAPAPVVVPDQGDEDDEGEMEDAGQAGGANKRKKRRRNKNKKPVEEHYIPGLVKADTPATKPMVGGEPQVSKTPATKPTIVGSEPASSTPQQIKRSAPSTHAPLLVQQQYGTKPAPAPAPTSPRGQPQTSAVKRQNSGLGAIPSLSPETLPQTAPPSLASLATAAIPALHTQFPLVINVPVGGSTSAAGPASPSNIPPQLSAFAGGLGFDISGQRPGGFGASAPSDLLQLDDSTSFSVNDFLPGGLLDSAPPSWGLPAQPRVNPGPGVAPGSHLVVNTAPSLPYLSASGELSKSLGSSGSTIPAPTRSGLGEIRSDQDEVIRPSGSKSGQPGGAVGMGFDRSGSKSPISPGSYKAPSMPILGGSIWGSVGESHTIDFAPAAFGGLSSPLASSLSSSNGASSISLPAPLAAPPKTTPAASGTGKITQRKPNPTPTPPPNVLLNSGVTNPPPHIVAAAAANASNIRAGK